MDRSLLPSVVTTSKCGIMIMKKDVRWKTRIVEFERLILSPKRVNITVVVVFTTILLLMLIFWNHRVGLFVTSIIMLGYGSFVQEGWQKGKRFRTIVFVVAIVMGGLLLTRAWNLIDEYEKKKAIMLAIVRDWKLNSQVLEFPKFSSTDDETLSQGFPYPTFYSGSLNPAISSGVFRHNNHNDVETLRIICAYSIRLIKLQNKLDLSDQTLFVGLGRHPLEECRKVRNSFELSLFKRAHNKLGDVLKRDGWLAEEQFFVMPENLVIIRELHGSLDSLLNRDPNDSLESPRVDPQKWTILKQWHAQLSDMLKPSGCLVREGLLGEDHCQKIRTLHNMIGQVLEKTPSNTDGFHVLNKEAYREIVRFYGIMSILLKYDKWIIKELDLLQLDI